MAPTITKAFPLNLFVGPVDPRLPWQSWAFSVRRVFASFTVECPVTVSKVRFAINVSSGNLDLGIYTDDGTTLTKIASTGLFACPASGVRTQNLTTSVTLVPGRRYWAAWAPDNTSGSMYGSAPNGSFSLIETAALQRQNTVGGAPLPASVAIPAAVVASTPTAFLAFS